MKFVSDPPISVKIDKMKQRVRWQEPALKERRIDQTRLAIDDGKADEVEFSFFVVGDSGCGDRYGHNPQRKIAEMMLRDRVNFILHTGDVVYQVGSSEYYYDNFIEPYREWLVGGESPQQITYDRLVFNLPFLPVPGNHDYYDLPFIYGILSQATWGLRRLLPTKLDFDVGWHGSFQGQTYAKAFLDYLLAYQSPQDLAAHLDRHYSARISGDRCLHYQPGHFTRLPNRYYTFCYGGIDFFALDSNTFNDPFPLPHTEAGDRVRQELAARRQVLEIQKQEILARSEPLKPEREDEGEELDDNRGKLNQIEEEQRDIDKTLDRHKIVTDVEQLNWLKERLIESWQNEKSRGRVLYFHHPPYVTEKTKWHQGQTLAVRRRLRQVFNEVAASIGEISKDRPVVDLVLSGHAHCLEHLYTEDTGNADSHINWVVCGGSGHSLRRQRPEGPLLVESDVNGRDRQVARSLKFIGRNGRGSQKRRPYSCLRVDVRAGKPPKFVMRPYVAERERGRWHDYQLESFAI